MECECDVKIVRRIFRANLYFDNIGSTQPAIDMTLK